MKIRIFNISILAVTIIAAAALTTMAQGNLRYQTRYSKAQVSAIIAKLETSSNKFRRDFDKAMDKSRYNGTQAEDDYNRNVIDFENALDQLRSEFNRTNSWWETRNQVSNVVSRGQSVDSMMTSISFRRNLERQWNAMRNDVNTLADTFDLPGLNGGGWNGGQWDGGGWNNNNNGNWGGQTSTPPSWAQGTFYGVGPNGAQITLTISSNGQATANVGGSLTYGTYYRGIITFGGNQARLNRTNAGLETVSTSNRETIQYSRTTWGGGVVNTGGRPPSWAIGTFRATNSPTGGSIIMTVNRDGNVFVSMDGGASGSSGTLDGSLLSINGNTARVYRQGNGFRTVSTTDGQTIYYVRN